jgi:hypothetical protein
MKNMKYSPILSMTPEKNISVSSETLHRSMNVRTTNSNSIKRMYVREIVMQSKAKMTLWASVNQMPVYP